jgi:hypothetical protein
MIGLAGCQSPTPSAPSGTPAADASSAPSATATAAAVVGSILSPVDGTPAPTETPRPTPAPDTWKSYPAIPGFDDRVQEIFRRGLAIGHDPHVFSKIGDCQNINTYYLADYEKPEKYRLGPYQDLQATIDGFKGSFGRKSLAVKGGMNVAAVMNPLRADPDSCQPSESPLVCELRINNPGVAIISFEEAWNGYVEKYESYLRQVIEYVIDQGVVPVVATKADNLEGGDRINALVARLAWEYDIPLWNFWGAVQPLPSHGLSPDGFHLTQGYGFHNFYFDLPPSRWSGWMARNLTALQVLDAARSELIIPLMP